MAFSFNFKAHAQKSGRPPRQACRLSLVCKSNGGTGPIAAAAAAWFVLKQS
jgi:hypothetical protein